MGSGAVFGGSRGGLNEIGTVSLYGLASSDIFLVGEFAVLEENLNYGLACGVNDSRFVGLNRAPVTIFDGAHVDDYVDLVCAITNGSLSFNGPGLTRVCIGEKTSNGTHAWGVTG